MRPTPAPASTGLRVLKVEARGPRPIAARTPADGGADVVRTDRPQERGPLRDRGTRSIRLALEAGADRVVLTEVAAQADTRIDSTPPEVAERLGWPICTQLSIEPPLCDPLRP